jgi:hypothetical protein
MKDMQAPDVMILIAEWPERALVRAQLIEAGHDVVGIDAWPMPNVYRVPGMRPKLLLLDLQGLPHPRETLKGVSAEFPPDRVLVVTALGTIPVDELRRAGYHLVERPATVARVVTAVSGLLETARHGPAP